MRHARTARHARIPTAAAWLALGSLLLVLTPLPAHTATLGWTPAFWLVGAPLCVLLVLEPRLPLRLLAAALRQWQRPRRAFGSVSRIGMGRISEA